MKKDMIYFNIFSNRPNDEKAEIELTYNWDGDDLGQLGPSQELKIFMKLFLCQRFERSKGCYY